MKNSFNFFSSTTGIVVTGLLLGLIAVFLQFSGNPGNMGICVVCFNRDIAGAVGLHRAPIVQYLRPEIMGMVLGSLAAALCFGEYRARGGSAPAVRFLLGVIAAIGALVFLVWPAWWSASVWARSSSAWVSPWAAARARARPPA